MKKVLAVLLIVAMLLSLGAGVVMASEGPTEETDETLNVMLQQEPDYLTPIHGLNQYSVSAIFPMYEPLIRNNNNELVPWLATEWEWLDGLHLTMTLRDNVYFHNGEKLKSSDVLYSLKMGLEGESASYYEKFDIDNFEIIDDLHFTIALKTPCMYLTEITGTFMIVSEKGVEEVGAQAAAGGGLFGTGPYVFSEWNRGQYIKVTRNENYWNPDAIHYYKDIVFTYNSEAAQRAMSLESGSVDVVTTLATSSVSELEGVDGIKLYEGMPSAVYSFIMNNSVAPFDDARVREAIYLLIDPYAVLAVVAEGRGVVADTIWKNDLSVYKQPAGSEERAVNVERAKELLAEAGYENGLDITIMNQVPFQAINEVIQANLAAGGINATLNTLDLGAYFEAYNTGSYQCYTGIIDQSDLNLALDKLDGRVGPAKAMGGIVASYPELEELIDIARTEIDDETRFQAFADIQQYLFDNHNVVGLYARVEYAGMKEDQEGFTFNVGPQLPRVEDMYRAD